MLRAALGLHAQWDCAGSAVICPGESWEEAARESRRGGNGVGFVRGVSGFAGGRHREMKRRLYGSASPLGVLLLSFATAGPALSQTAAPAGDDLTTLPRIQVTLPRSASTRAAPSPKGGEPLQSPLNIDAVADSASRLGLTSREIPATVEVIDRQTIEDRGFKTVTDVAQGAVGVTAGDAPGAPSAFSMRGFSFSEINTLYNGIRIGPQGMTSRIMDTGNLQQVEILKGPASLMSGEGASGGAINFVTKTPHTGPIRNDAFTSFDSFDGYRFGLGSGGSTLVKGLDYRVDLTRSSNNSFIDDAGSKLFNVSGQLDYRIADNFKIWGAIEYKQDRERFYYGTPLVSAAFSGPFATSGVVSGNTASLGAVTIDSRTLRTNYNVLDNNSGANELWLRGGVDWLIASNVRFKSQFYSYDADRHWLNSEFYQFNPGTNQVDRDRFFVAHNQTLVGNISDLTVDSTIAGLDNRTTVALAASHLVFKPSQAANFPSDSVDLVNPVRGVYGPLVTQNFYTRLDNIALSLEDRLKLTHNFALVGGVRVESIELARSAFEVDGSVRPNYPFSKTFTPITGRIGYTWEALPGLTFYSQYATAADAAVANIFNISPTRPQELTTSRTYETGVKQLLWGGRAEWTLSAFDIERRNVYSPLGPPGAGIVEVAGKVASKGVELAGAVRPDNHWKFWGNVAWVDARLEDFSTDSFSGNRPPNVPRLVANAGASYRFDTPWPVEVGGSVRHVGDRFMTYDNVVTMNGYTVMDAYAFVDLPKSVFASVEQTRLAFRVRNLTNRTYAVWADPGYTEQVLLGAPRSYEVSAAFKF
jgi:iron complex outermembrane receptor protein